MPEPHNYYFVILAEGGNDADVIAEALAIARKLPGTTRSVQINVCGTQEKKFDVFQDGGVAVATPKAKK